MNKYYVMLLLLIGCATPAKVVEAPTSIFVDGKVNEPTVKDVEPAPLHKRLWTISIYDKYGHDSWSYADTKIAKQPMLSVKLHDWQCSIITEIAYPYIQMTVVECVRNETWATVRTGPVACSEHEADSSYAEKDGLEIRITCNAK